MVYEGPLSKPLRMLKLVSITSCSLTLTATPLVRLAPARLRALSAGANETPSRCISARTPCP